MDLFESAAAEHLRSSGPLASRLRPHTIDDIVGQEHLLGEGCPLRRLVEADRLQSMILWGPPGTGKTSIAHAISVSTSSEFEQLSAVSAGVKDVREVIDRARERLGARAQRTVLFLDEIHRFSRSQQDALLPAVEDGSIVLIGATTENPSFQVNPALLSRSLLFRLHTLSESAGEVLVRKGCAVLGTDVEPAALAEIIRTSAGDGRQMLALLEIADALREGASISIADVERAIGSSALRYGVDEHYDVVSAFIKSMRGGDPQASVLYLARMLASGEDPRFIARRMMIFASEDVGLADPQALVQATAAAHALDAVGLPEAQLNLAQAALYLATAPRSNAVAQAIWNARADVERGPAIEVPAHLRDAHYPIASALGHGVGYVNPHDSDARSAAQSYLPRNFEGRVWYRPSNAGFEVVIRTRMGVHETEFEAQGSVPSAGGSDEE